MEAAPGSREITDFRGSRTQPRTGKLGFNRYRVAPAIAIGLPVLGGKLKGLFGSHQALAYSRVPIPAAGDFVPNVRFDPLYCNKSMAGLSFALDGLSIILQFCFLPGHTERTYIGWMSAPRKRGRLPAENSRNVALRRRVSLLQEFSEEDQET